MDSRAVPTAIERFPEEWVALFAAWGEPRFRAEQVFRWIHGRGVQDPDAMTDLPAPLRARLREDGLAPAMEVARARPSDDGTRKLLLRMHDGREVETVLLPDDNAVTQCISSQVGCAMGCVFCASGVAGLKRHMSAAEIVSQVLCARAHLDPDERLRNIVFMGMGEPLHNYEAVSRTIRLLAHPWGAGLALRRITVSTSGLVPQIDQLATDFGGQVQLAVSLHAPTDEQRSSIVPINRKHPLDELVACLRRYPLPKQRRITIEYTLLEGVNDSPSDAKRLVAVLRSVPIKVNLIPMNPVEGSPLRAPSDHVVHTFQKTLRNAGIHTFIRKQRGDDIDAACGQLALRGERPRKRALMVL